MGIMILKGEKRNTFFCNIFEISLIFNLINKGNLIVKMFQMTDVPTYYEDIFILYDVFYSDAIFQINDLFPKIYCMQNIFF